MSSIPQAQREHGAVPADASFAAGETSAPDKSTYREILRSTVLIGGSSAINILIGIVRTKAMAILLGPGGFGLMGALSSVADLVRSVAEMGVNSSGVRQIAESVGSGDAQRIARTAAVLRRTAGVLALLGAVLLVISSKPVAVLTFGSEDYRTAVAVLSLAVFFRLLADGQGALIQGMRRIGDMAKIAVLGSLYGTLLSVPIVYWLREDGVAWALVAVAFASAVVAWWYARKVAVERPVIAFPEFRRELRGLLKLGLAFMTSGLLSLGAAYIVRIVLIRYDGLEAAGLYQAAWTLGGLYVSFVLQAMGADFYPRLVGVAGDDAECSRLVNEQAHISVLLAGAGVIVTLALAPLVIQIFYSAQFGAATGTLRWICLGMMLRVISWPMGFIIVAKGAKTVFVLTDLAWAIVNVGLSWLLVKWFGVEGAGIAFFASYVFHALMIYLVVRTMNGFRWSGLAFGTGAATVALILIVFGGFYLLPNAWALATSFVAALLAGLYSIHTLLTLASPELLPRRLRTLRARAQRTGNN